MADSPQPQVGDLVDYFREDYVGRVDRYDGMITALNDDGTCTLSVAYLAGPVNMKGRYDPDGKPSSFRPKEV